MPLILSTITRSSTFLIFYTISAFHFTLSMGWIPRICLAIIFVVNSNVMPAKKLQRHYHILNYQCTCKTQAKGIINSMHMNVSDNPADIVPKSCASNICFLSMNPILFFHDMYFLKESCFGLELKHAINVSLLSS